LNIFLSTNNDKIESKGQLLEKNRYYVNLEHIKKIKTKKEEYILSYNFIKKFLDIIKEHYIKIEYDFITENNVMIIKCAKLLNNENNIISIDFDDRKSHKYGPIKVFSDLFNLTELDTQNILKSLKKIFVNQNTIFSFCYNTYLEENSSVFAFYLSEIFQVFISASSEEFDNDNINYVSPLRATPKRYYFLDSARTHISVDTFDGDSIAEILKDNTKLKKQVNEWFRRFDIEIEVDYLKDIIHSLLVNQNSLKLDISDVGFGISQVLPVIMQGYLSHNDSITLVEQPEIHLHPKMQADLGDLFIDIVLNKNYSARKRIPKKNFIIETHSEYLLKRIRRRISEGRIPSEMVSLNLITPQSSTQGAIISELQISETGNFEWPKDFYGGELLKDVTEFFKKQ
jgi:hypothetical protein